jgi:hypothetical protein
MSGAVPFKMVHSSVSDELEHGLHTARWPQG